jgi:predicted XRE-type DNA-binding protein
LPSSNRSQITPFIIIVLVLLAGITIFLIFKDSLVVNKNINIPADISPVYSVVNDCLQKNLIEGIDYVSQKGGYYDTPEKAIDMEIAYYLYKNQNNMPSKEKIENEISNYINNEIQFCLNDISELGDFEITGGEISSTTSIEEDKVSLKMNYPLSISRGEKTYSLNEFETEYKTRLGLVYNISRQIVEEQMKDREIIPIGFLYDLGVKNNVFIKTVEYKGDVIFTITDENSKLNERALVFNFVNKYN